MKDKPKKENAEMYDFGADFKILTSGVRRIILKTAKNLLKQQQENNALLDDILLSKKEKWLCGQYLCYWQVLFCWLDAPLQSGQRKGDFSEVFVLEPLTMEPQ